MAQPKPGIEGNIAGHPITGSGQQKIQDVLKTTLKAELASVKAPTTVVGGRHGSVTHGSVIFEE